MKKITKYALFMTALCTTPCYSADSDGGGATLSISMNPDIPMNSDIQLNAVDKAYGSEIKTDAYTTPKTEGTLFQTMDPALKTMDAKESSSVLTTDPVYDSTATSTATPSATSSATLTATPIALPLLTARATQRGATVTSAVEKKAPSVKATIQNRQKNTSQPILGGDPRTWSPQPVSTKIASSGNSSATNQKGATLNTAMPNRMPSAPPMQSILKPRLKG